MLIARKIYDNQICRFNFLENGLIDVVYLRYLVYSPGFDSRNLASGLNGLPDR
jgi:hypothetical protein